MIKKLTFRPGVNRENTRYSAEGTFDEVWPSIKRAVDAIVSAFNTAKVFKK